MFKNEQILFLAKFFKQENKDSSFKDMTDPDNLEDYIVRKISKESLFLCKLVEFTIYFFDYFD